MPCSRASRRSTERAAAGSWKAARGYSLFSARTGTPIARLRPTGGTDQVQVLWWNGERWRASGPFGIATLPLDQALDYIAAEPAFWIDA
jgi:hypothetical protein